MKRKDELRDIYQSDNHDFEKDFTPQVAREIIEDRQRSLFRNRLVTLFLGGVSVIISVAIVAVIARNLLNEREIKVPVPIEDQSYIPRHSLSKDAAWVLDYSPKQINESLEREEPGEKPVSTKWVKYAAYHIIMGQQALSLKEYDQAMEYFNQVLDVYPNIEGLHKTVGMLYIQEEKYDLAAEHLEKSLAEQEQFDVVNNLGTAYIGTKEYDRAEKHLLRALEMQSENPICHKNLALLYRKMDKQTEAMFHFEKYLDLQPEDLETMQTYALYLTKQGRWEEAATFLKQLTSEVTDVAPIYFLLAQVQVQNGQEEEAMVAMRRGIQLIDPNLALAWMSRDEFNSVRETQEFRTLMDKLEIDSVSLKKLD